MSGPGNREVRPEVIYDLKIKVEMICGNVCFVSLRFKSDYVTGETACWYTGADCTHLVSKLRRQTVIKSVWTFLKWSPRKTSCRSSPRTVDDADGDDRTPYRNPLSAFELIWAIINTPHVRHAQPSTYDFGRLVEMRTSRRNGNWVGGW